MPKLQHQNSMAAFEKYHGGCTQSWLHIFNFQLHQHHMPSRRLLEHSSHGKKTKDPKIYVPLPSKEHENWDSEANFLIVNESKLKKKISSKALLRGLSKMFSKKQQQKPKALTSKERQHDTPSSYHLQCNNYVLHEETVHDSGMSDLDENIRLLQKGEGCQICRALDAIDYIKKTRIDNHSTGKEAKMNQRLRKTWEIMKKKESTDKKRDAFESKDFLTVIELYNAHKDLFVKILEDPKFSMEKFAKELHLSSSGRTFLKPGSFPMGIPARNVQSSKHSHGWVANFDSVDDESKHTESKHNIEETPITSQEKNFLHVPSSKSGTKVDMEQPKPRATESSETLNSDSDKYKNHKEDEMALNHIRDLFEDIINEKKEQHRISKDAIMHKIPYGQKISEEAVMPKLFRSTSDRGDNSNLRLKLSAPSIRHQDRSMRRSRSLSDSLDRYSNLLASITTNESKRLPETSSSRNEDTSFQDEANPQHLQSTCSNIEKIRPISKQIHHEAFNQSLPSVASLIGLHDGKRELENQVSTYQNSVDILVDKENIMSDLTERHTSNTTDGTAVDEHKEQVFLITDDKQIEKCHVLVKAEECEGTERIHREMTADLANQLFDNEIQQGESLETLDSRKAGNKQTTLHEHKEGFIFETDDEPTKPSPVSVLDSKFEEEFARRLQPELDFTNRRWHKLVFDMSDTFEDTE